MYPTSAPLESKRLAFLTAVFILLFFMLFSYSGLFAYFTFDDGTAVVHDLRHFEVPMWKNILHILTVFTTAYRPLATMFWRPLYAIFGYNPLPYRITEHLFMVFNIALAYTLARRLEVPRDGAALTALFFCYNASMSEMYYDTCIVTDVLCFFFYVLGLTIYIRGRQSGDPLTRRRIAAVVVCYALALDAKELAVAFPAILSTYELFYHGQDFRQREKAIRVGGALAGMFVIGAIYLGVKVPQMGQNASYHPHVTVGWVATNISLYLGQLLYQGENSFRPLGAGLVLAAVIAIALLLRSRAAVFGVLYFLIALIPVAVIPHRGAYCAYIPYFGLALAGGAILSSARSLAMRRFPGRKLEMRSIVAMFVLVAILVGRAHVKEWNNRNGFFEWFTPQVTGLYNNLERTIPEFPPGARVLLFDPWAGDWGQMLLVQFMYHDNTVWIDRPKNMDRPPDPAAYDLVINYTPPIVDLAPARLFGFALPWQIRGSSSNFGQFAVSSPHAHGAGGRIDFNPQAVRSGQPVTVIASGLSNVAVNALYRTVSGATSTRSLVKNWCTLDAKGTCTITAPPVDKMGALVLDWIQPADQHWIFTTGVLTIVD